MSNLRSVDGSSVCFGINITQAGEYTVTYVNNDLDTGEAIYTTDFATVAAFLADKTREHFVLRDAKPPESTS